MPTIATLALSQLFGVILKEGEPIVEAQVLAQIRKTIDHQVPKVAKNDEDHGWSSTHQGDPRNDYAGDILAKRADNALFVFGKSLPGNVTDFIRDTLSPGITPGVRAQIDENTSAAEIATLVGDALYGKAVELAESVGP